MDFSRFWKAFQSLKCRLLLADYFQTYKAPLLSALELDEYKNLCSHQSSFKETGRTCSRVIDVVAVWPAMRATKLKVTMVIASILICESDYCICGHN